MEDTEIRHDRDLIILAVILGSAAILGILCCAGGAFWVMFG